MAERDIIAQFELKRLLLASGRYLDERNFQAYLDLYQEQGSYAIVTQAPEPTVIMQCNRDALQERLTGSSGQDRAGAEVEQSRVVSVEIFKLSDTTVQTSSSVALYHTSPDGTIALYADGHYQDCWENAADTWKLRSRRVVLKTRRLRELLPLPI